MGEHNNNNSSNSNNNNKKMHGNLKRKSRPLCLPFLLPPPPTRPLLPLPSVPRKAGRGGRRTQEEEKKRKEEKRGGNNLLKSIYEYNRTFLECNQDSERSSTWWYLARINLTKCCPTSYIHLKWSKILIIFVKIWKMNFVEEITSIQLMYSLIGLNWI